MSENLDNTPENADKDALDRAERIKAIKNALKETESLPDDVSDEIPEIPEAPEAEQELPEEEPMADEPVYVPEHEAVPEPVNAADVIAADAIAASRDAVTEDKTIAYKIPEHIHEAPRSYEEQPAAVGAGPVSRIADDPISKSFPEIPKKKKKKTLGQRFRGLFPEKGDSVLECVRKIVFLASVVAIMVCGYMVGDYYLDLWRNRMQNDSISDLYDTYPVEKTTVKREAGERYYDMLVAARKLMDINPEVIGYMKIEGTPIDLPVVQAKDNVKYLDLNFKGEESRPGTLFLDYRNHYDDVTDHHLNVENSGNLVVYGHNMGDDSMFGCLDNYQWVADYYEKHPIIKFNSNYDTYTYKIFAFFVVDADDETETKFDCWNKLDFSDEHDFYKFVNEAKRRTLRLNAVDVKYGDKLLTLSTCNDYLRDRGRLIVMARLIRNGEGLLDGVSNNVPNPNIKWPTMYYNTKTNEKYDPDGEFFPYGPEK